MGCRVLGAYKDADQTFKRGCPGPRGEGPPPADLEVRCVLKMSDTPYVS